MAKDIRYALSRVARWLAILLAPVSIWFLAATAATQSAPADPRFYEILLGALLVLSCIICLLTDERGPMGCGVEEVPEPDTDREANEKENPTREDRKDERDEIQDD